MKLQRRSAEFFSFLFEPQVPLLFLFGALVVAVMGNATYDLLMEIGGKTRKSLAFALVGCVLLIVMVVIGLKARAEIVLRRTTARVGGSKAFSVPRRALIFTVGKQPDTIELCLQNQRPEFVGFVCTSGSESITNELVKSYGLTDDTYIKRVVDPWNVGEVRAESNVILSWALSKSKSPGEIAFDVTGGLTSMSVGAFMVAEENRIDSQYVRSEYDDRGKRLPNTEEAIFIRRYSPETN